VFRDKEAEQEQILEFGGRSDQMDMRLSQHMIQEHEGKLNYMIMDGRVIRKGQMEIMGRVEWEQNKEDKG